MRKRKKVAKKVKQVVLDKKSLEFKNSWTSPGKIKIHKIDLNQWKIL